VELTAPDVRNHGRLRELRGTRLILGPNRSVPPTQLYGVAPCDLERSPGSRVQTRRERERCRLAAFHDRSRPLIPMGWRVAVGWRVTTASPVECSS
jgi:hypothetical protein